MPNHRDEVSATRRSKRGRIHKKTAFWDAREVTFTSDSRQSSELRVRIVAALQPMQFAVEVLLDLRIFLVELNLLDLQWETQPDGKIALGDRQIAGLGHAGIEVLVEPVERRRHDRAGLPGDLHRRRI